MTTGFTGRRSHGPWAINRSALSDWKSLMESSETIYGGRILISQMAVTSPGPGPGPAGPGGVKRSSGTGC